MRELRYVGPGDDADHVVIESDDGDEQFNLHITDDFRALIRSDLPRLADIQSEPVEVSLRPREIQMRVRAGESPQTLADEAGVAIERVLRFATPVLEERARITNEARRGRARRVSGADGQMVDFGESVDTRFAAHGIEPSSVEWDSARRDDGVWVVSASWQGGESRRVARWAFALGQRLITPMDETAADLLSDRPIRPIVHIVPEFVAPSNGVTPDEQTGPLPNAARDAFFDQHAHATDSPSNASSLAPSNPPPIARVLNVGRPPNISRPAPEAANGHAPEAANGHAPEAPQNHAPEASAGHAPQASGEDASDAQNGNLPTAQPNSYPAAGHSDEADTDTPALPLRLADPVPGVEYPTPRPAETDEQKAERARIPSWDDILLGVRRKRD
ncbi:MAG: DUF3071 domain-containing protein [Actinobacteria bacterium]|nr:DUF3071 domain-containing protein [Actinomycetota bacterium]